MNTNLAGSMAMKRPPTVTTNNQAALLLRGAVCASAAVAIADTADSMAIAAVYAAQPVAAAGICLVGNAIALVAAGIAYAATYAEGSKTENINVVKIRKDGLIPEKVLEARLREINYSADKVHIAVTGASGVGKSTFLNAIRGISDADDDFAKTGTDETTVGLHRYQDPSFPWLVWYDMAGSGTKNATASNYFENSSLFAFDCIIILWKDRLGENVHDIITAVDKLPHKIPIFLVRSASDVLISDIASKTPLPPRSRACCAKGYKKRCVHRQEAVKEHRRKTAETIKSNFSNASPASFLISSKLIQLLTVPYEDMVIPAPKEVPKTWPERLKWLTLDPIELRRAVEEEEVNQYDAFESYDLLDEQHFLQEMFAGVAQMRA